MKLSTKIALRYIFTFRSFHFITIITFISLLAIIIGNITLICVMSIFNGFREFAIDQLVSFDPHLRIVASEGAFVQDAEKLISKIKQDSNIQYILPINQARIIIQSGNDFQIAQFNSAVNGKIQDVSGIEQSIVFGSFNIKKEFDINNVVVGGILANKLKLSPGDTILLTSPEKIEKSVKAYKQLKWEKVAVSGIFQTNDKQYDEFYIYGSDEIFHNLFNIPENSASSIDIRLNDVNLAFDYKEKIKEDLAQDLEVLTWWDLHKDLFSVMQFERMSTFSILSIIIIIAAFNVLASLVMTVIEKKPDISLLKALGAKDKLIREIFLKEGVIIGIIGSTIGTLIGVGLCLGQLYFKWFSLDTDRYLIDALPLSIHTGDVLLVFFFSLILSIVVTLYPARRAGKVSIIQEIRSE